jgi:hypothetical protein
MTSIPRLLVPRAEAERQYRIRFNEEKLLVPGI